MADRELNLVKLPLSHPQTPQPFYGNFELDDCGKFGYKKNSLLMSI